MTDHSEKPWTPEQKLRSSATDGEISDRWYHLFGERGSLKHGDEAEVTLARELASAVSLEKDAEIARLRAELKDATYGMVPDPRMST